ncbi:SRPBCC family protein [Pseudohoeflea coraliihabitans]|uniref:SRPBCC family protein n=1 Tax=Pseudohoeflea coraliihabitans TaxID=2860393 RepID=A0ABS6WL89_9HYPH|nr:SRPBCC family protein [Pseudohoeflea sp. DP4N28-3]MBW3095834.1 SRPBCC family protein [Pseudohoeflea sp. DP4N28-3]
MPVLSQNFTVDHPREQVWATFQDLPLVVRCLPGASLDEEPKDNVAKGRMTVKLGPVKADFAGEAEIDADATTYTGTIKGKGIDKSHASRAKGDVVYHLEELSAGKTGVKVDVDYTLSGSLAQFARGGIVEAVAEQITLSFARNLEKELNASANADAAPVAQAGETPAGAAQPQAAATAPAAPGGTAAKPAEAPKQRAAEPSNELNALDLFWAVLKSKIKRLFGRS